MDEIVLGQLNAAFDNATRNADYLQSETGPTVTKSTRYTPYEDALRVVICTT